MEVSNFLNCPKPGSSDKPDVLKEHNRCRADAFSVSPFEPNDGQVEIAAVPAERHGL